MRWSDTISLISQKPPEEKTNENGFPYEEIEESRLVFGNKKPAWQSEFYKAQQIGITIEFKFDIYKADYEGEEFAEYNDKRYKILRTQESKNGEFIELTLSDLSERGENLGYF